MERGDGNGQKGNGASNRPGLFKRLRELPVVGRAADWGPRGSRAR